MKCHHTSTVYYGGNLFKTIFTNSTRSSLYKLFYNILVLVIRVVGERCKYYINGICYSSFTIKTFGEPSAEPVDPKVCLSNRFTECRYYAEGSAQSFEESIVGESIHDVYFKIHLITCELFSQCPFFETKVVDEEKKLCIARCIMFDKYLTRSAVKKCVEYWQQCPIYRSGVEFGA